MNLNRISWLKKWLLKKVGSGKTKAWVTAKNVRVSDWQSFPNVFQLWPIFE